MDSFKKFGFLVTSFFLLISLLGDPAEACCGYSHPQSTYCWADFVIRAKFMAKHKISDYRSLYNIKITEVYKGPEAMPETLYVLSAPKGVCRFSIREPYGKQEYVITGHIIENNTARTTKCQFIRPWAGLSRQLQSAISEKYSKGCSCMMGVDPFTGKKMELKNGTKCIGYDDVVSKLQDEREMDNQICLPESENSASCSWQSLNS